MKRNSTKVENLKNPTNGKVTNTGTKIGKIYSYLEPSSEFYKIIQTNDFYLMMNSG